MKYLLGLLLLTQQVFGVTLKDYDYYNYDVFFTNPICPAYELKEPVYSNSGELLENKPANVYCKYSDAKKNQKRKTSPHYNLVKLITHSDLKELKMAYLSFSNSDIIKKVCDVAIKNNVKFTLFVDKKNKDKADKMEKLNKLKACKPDKKFIEAGTANYPRVEFRGHNGQLGFAHNKIIIASFKAEEKKRTIVFSSANMSSGTTLHHENWHFVTTSSDSYFAQTHECVIEGMDKHTNSIRRSRSRKGKSAKKAFGDFVKKCRSEIEAEEESDIKVYIVPGEGHEAMDNIVSKIAESKKVSVAVHRFTHNDLLTALQKAGRSKKQEVRFVSDDDIYWSGMANYVEGKKKIVCSSRNNPNFVDRVGANMCNEYFKVQRLKRSKVKIKYMETNQSLFLLHHNKYLVFELKDGTLGLHCGAGNFTKAAFDKNFENYYYITIPEVVEKFKKQYEYVWNELATAEKDLPEVQVLP